ncbi:MAG: hypothetical protein EPN73_18700, partial [Paraburkholderia sp.]|uniref:hypothetical protein n=1 Tax=Paraburkholderia sp. TaxID=1926495 RepID=UPI001204ACDA
MTLNLSSSRIVIVIRSVAAIHASGAGVPAAGQHTHHESGHFSFAQVRHYSFAPTNHVEAGFKCPGLDFLEMSGFEVQKSLLSRVLKHRANPRS